LLTALRRGTPSTAALDVFVQEPLPSSHPFWKMDQVIVSPHMSGDTFGFEDLILQQFKANLEHWSRGFEIRHVVDKRKFAFASK
jgi:phosphoglycerate dehydrogenase-like enzyme